MLSFIFPIIFLILTASTLPVKLSENKIITKDLGISEKGIYDTTAKRSLINILSEKDLVSQIEDTVYTDLDCWLELRIDLQMLYQHWRNGQVDKYPVSSGDKLLDKGVESRPGLFAIFYKNRHHISSQFNSADMYDFMPFNMGIGFHSLDGTGYYGNLGRAPSSHGCIRMRHEDAAKIFKDCPLGTLVLAHRGNSIRTVGFAPKNYKNEIEYSKDDYKIMLSKNLYNVLEGNYYIADRYYFVVDPKIIPKSGIYIAHDKSLPEKQKLPSSSFQIKIFSDRLNSNKFGISSDIQDKSFLEECFSDIISDESNPDTDLNDDKALIKKYFNNPIGVLPYYGPNN